MNELVSISQELIYFAIPAIFLAGLIHGIFGIGFPMVATPLLALFTDVITAVLITLLPTMAVNLSIIWREGKKGLDVIRPHLFIVPFVLIGTLTGSLFLIWLDPRPFLLVLAAAIALYLNQDRLQYLNFGWVRKNTKVAYVLFGLTAGLMAGTVNVMLPILIILLLELRIATASMVVFFNINFFMGKITQSLFFSHEMVGFWSFIVNSLWLVPVALFSLYIGSYLRKYIHEERYMKILRGILWAMTGVLIIRFILSYASL